MEYADVIEKLKAIRSMSVIYNICYRNAGVGFMFYEEPRSTRWEDGLVVYAYYPTLEEAVDAEFLRLKR
jgi:hypothetical protein